MGSGMTTTAAKSDLTIKKDKYWRCGFEDVRQLYDLESGLYIHKGQTYRLPSLTRNQRQNLSCQARNISANLKRFYLSSLNFVRNIDFDLLPGPKQMDEREL